MRQTDFAGRIACIGEAMVELSGVADDDHTLRVGFAGDALNTAIYLRRLMTTDTPVAFVTRLGYDTFSTRMLDFIHSESIQTDQIERTDARQVGLYAIDTDANGERTFSYWRDNSAARTLFQTEDGTLNFSSIDTFDVLYLSAITLAILPPAVRSGLLQYLDQRRQSGACVVFDSNYRPALWESREVAQQNVASAWRISDIALPSLDDEMALFSDANEQTALSRLHGYGIAQGALKRGAAGPLALGVESSLATVALPPTPATVLDTTAAGDSFNAGYLSAILSGASGVDAMQAGHDLALRVIGQRGAIIPADNW
jgi:2-dehydro-3-deoxygluconokinase